MEKNYKNKEMTGKSEKEKNKKQFFFPKENPPTVIFADSIEEAEEKLKVINNKKYE